MTASVVRDVILRLKVENKAMTLKPPDTTPVSESMKKLEAEVDATLNRISKKQATVNQLVNNSAQTVGGKASPTGNGTDSDVVGKLRISGDAFRIAGEGALHVARGMAFMNAMSEEDLALTLKRIAYYQGLYDIYRGGWDIIKGLTVGTRALIAASTVATAATAAQAAAEETATIATMSHTGAITVQTVAQYRLAVATGTADVALGGLAAVSATSAGTVGTLSVAMNFATGVATRMWLAVTGPIGWAIALTSALAAGAYGWYRYSYSVEEARKKLAKQVEELHAVRKAEQDLHDMRQSHANATAAAGRRADLRNFALDNPRMFEQDKNTLIEADAKSDREKRVLSILQNSDIDRKGRFFGDRANVNFRGHGERKPGDFPELTQDPRGFLTLLKNASHPEDARALIRGIGGGLKDAVSHNDPENFSRVGGGFFGPLVSPNKPKQQENVDKAAAKEKVRLEQEVARQEELTSAGESQLGFVRDHAKQLQNQELTLRDIVKHEKDRQAAIEAGVRAENQRGLSDVEKVGRMNPDEQRQLKEIASNINAAGGSVNGLNPGQLAFLDQTGLSAQKVSRHFINKGKALGAEGILADLGSGNITAQEEAGGAGFEGKNRKQFLLDQQASSKATEQRGDSQLQKTLQDIQATRQLENDYIKQLGDNSQVLDTLKQALLNRDKALAQFKSDLDKLGATVALSNLQQTQAWMNGR